MSRGGAVTMGAARPAGAAGWSGAGLASAPCPAAVLRTIVGTVTISERTTTETPRGRILVVDDEIRNRSLLKRLLARAGHETLEADSGEAALAATLEHEPDVILLDVMMGGMNGFETCAQLKQHPRTRLVPVVLVTALNDRQDRLQGIEAGADDFLTKPVDPHQLTARVQSLVRLKRYTDDLDSAEAVIVSLALTIEARDRATEGHCQRLAQYGSAMGRALGLHEDDVFALHRGGFLHDIGKVGVPDAVLQKAGRLSPAEFELMKTHTLIGDRLCGQLRSLRRVRPIVRHHHERLDGSGYPDGLRGDEIPLLAQIMTIADIYDALTTARPYKPAWAPARAIEELYREVRCGWRRRDLVDACADVVATPGRRRGGSPPALHDAALTARRA
jgi:putative two-component system response regulator